MHSHFTHYRKYSTALLAALFVAAEFCSPAPSSAAPVPASCVPSDGNSRAHTDWYQECVTRVAAIKGKPCDLIFIGDSITQNFVEYPKGGWNLVGGPVWEKYYAHRNALNFGVGADKTQDVLWRLQHMDVQSLRPKVAVILIGTNNTGGDTPADIAAGVKAVIAQTQHTFPGVKIILLGILPTTRQTQKVVDANKIISTYPDGRTIFSFDLGSLMTPVGNNWKGIGHDHLHLTQEGYELWASQMEPMLDRLIPTMAQVH